MLGALGNQLHPREDVQLTDGIWSGRKVRFMEAATPRHVEQVRSHRRKAGTNVNNFSSNCILQKSVGLTAIWPNQRTFEMNVSGLHNLQSSFRDWLLLQARFFQDRPYHTSLPLMKKYTVEKILKSDSLDT
jgi:hypothetical protein